MAMLLILDGLRLVGVGRFLDGVRSLARLEMVLARRPSSKFMSSLCEYER